MNQQQVWNKITPEWNKFRTIPFPETIGFLKKQKGKILDLGSGSGRHLIKLKNGKMYEVDFSKEMIKLAKIKASKQKIPAEFFISESENLPFQKNFFDAGICTSLMQCIDTQNKRNKTIQELFRVLKPGSKALISTWDKNSSRYKNKPKKATMKWRNKGTRTIYFYDEQELKDKLKKVGFKIKTKIPNKFNIIFVVEKPSQI
ncbi:MAG: class I SAM-dependent methyltransferase [Nanoarchaeota archaeon]|nr:class I SAM-dependent methyltransferase [Nanoarchaeota archaeon]MBU1027458.1 class I SAM-dependent methyltransferase [Nanoarchaeota archaeon]